MSWFDYQTSKKIALDDPPFNALIMAAMNKADTNNVILLTNAFPEVWTELSQRYGAPNGVLRGDG